MVGKSVALFVKHLQHVVAAENIIKGQIGQVAALKLEATLNET